MMFKMAVETYKIIRFRKNGQAKVVQRGLTLEQAQAHCKSEATHKVTSTGKVIWFDDYEKEGK